MLVIIMMIRTVDDDDDCRRPARLRPWRARAQNSKRSSLRVLRSSEGGEPALHFGGLVDGTNFGKKNFFNS